MVEPSFWLFELIMYALFAACLWHASQRSRYAVLELVFGLIYGVFLEWMTLRQLSAYDYGQFLVMIDGAPLAIGVGWAVIIYSAMTFAERFAAPAYARALIAGLLALNIDLAMDAVAIRLGFWNWGVVSITEEWFGVPWGNFWAWFIVVSSYAWFLLYFQRHGWRDEPVKQWLYVPLSFVLSVIVLAVTNHLYDEILWEMGLGFWAMLILIGAGIVAIILAKPKLPASGPPDPVIIAVPLAFHLFFNIAGFLGGYYAELPVIAIVGIVMLIVGVGIHLWPWLAARRAGAPPSRRTTA